MASDFLGDTSRGSSGHRQGRFEPAARSGKLVLKLLYNIAVYPVVQAPNEILRKAAKRVDLPVTQLGKIIADMKATLSSQKDPEGIGLAAPQVGLSYRLFIAKSLSTSKAGRAGGETTEVFINPKIVERSRKLSSGGKKAPLEGCLSLPNYYGVVKRWQWVKVKYQRLGPQSSDQRLEEKVATFSGFPAIVVQHEIDHLDGKIFVERLLEQGGKLFKAVGGKKGKERWEEVEI